MYCVVCGGKFEYHEKTSHTKRKKQFTCSGKCYQRKYWYSKNPQKLTSKFCFACGDKFDRPKGKSTKVWVAQQCCGLDCASLSRRKEAPRDAWRRKELTPGARRFWRGSETIPVSAL